MTEELGASKEAISITHVSNTISNSKKPSWASFVGVALLESVDKPLSQDIGCSNLSEEDAESGRIEAINDNMELED